MNGFVLVTSNENKALEVERILGIRPPIAALDLPEIQEMDIRAIVEEKARDAYRHLGRPVVVEEVGFYLDALGGFPGPLVKWMLQTVGAAGIARTALALDEPNAVARCLLAHYDGDRLTVASGEAPGILIAEARGGQGFGWDPYFVAEGGDRTYAELDGAEKDRIGHRGRAWRD
ncbi:MAG: non-canonical purine NTP pyrophosphatase, partial [Acidobacteriota bacterium]